MQKHPDVRNLQFKSRQDLSYFPFGPGSNVAGHGYEGPQCQNCYLNPGIWGISVDLTYKLLGCNNDILYSMSCNLVFFFP